MENEPRDEEPRGEPNSFMLMLSHARNGVAVYFGTP